MSNEQIFSEYIEEMAKKYKAETLSVDWVKWMLEQLESSNKSGHTINPAWLRADSHVVMLTGFQQELPEPPMFIV